MMILFSSAKLLIIFDICKKKKAKKWILSRFSVFYADLHLERDDLHVFSPGGGD